MRKALAAVAVVSALAGTTATLVATDDTIDRAATQFLVELEGIELVPYHDVAGLKTCGVGHLLKKGERCPETLPAAMKLLADDQKNGRVYQTPAGRTTCVAVRGDGGVRLQCRMHAVQPLNSAQIS